MYGLIYETATKIKVPPASCIYKLGAVINMTEIRSKKITKTAALPINFKIGGRKSGN